MIGSRRCLVLSAMVVALGGCASRNRAVHSAANDAAAQAGSVDLVVRNNNFADMNVYAVSEGLATRVGTVTGLSSATFRLDPSFFPTDQLRIVGTPIGGNGRASSGQLTVSGGQTIQFTIEATLRQSFATIR